MSPSASPGNPILSSRVEGTALIAAIAGEVDLHSSPNFRGALLELLDRYKPARLVLNLGSVPYMDSSGIAVLVEALQRLRRAGGKVYLTSLQQRVRSVLEIARLDAIFVIANDEADALAR